MQLCGAVAVALTLAQGENGRCHEGPPRDVRYVLRCHLQQCLGLPWLALQVQEVGRGGEGSHTAQAHAKEAKEPEKKGRKAGLRARLQR